MEFCRLPSSHIYMYMYSRICHIACTRQDSSHLKREREAGTNKRDSQSRKMWTLTSGCGMKLGVYFIDVICRAMEIPAVISCLDATACEKSLIAGTTFHWLPNPPNHWNQQIRVLIVADLPHHYLLCCFRRGFLPCLISPICVTTALPWDV